MNSLNVQVVDDHDVAAAGLEALLSGCDGLNFLAPVHRVEDIDVDGKPVVICDLHLFADDEVDGVRTGAAAVSYVVEKLFLPVVATTGIAPPTAIANAIGAGAHSFVSKDGAFPVHVWRDAIAAAAVGQNLITARLAEALLLDAKVRPLPPEEDFNAYGRTMLHEALRDADSCQTRNHRNPANDAIAHATRQIWAVSRERRHRYTIEIPWHLRQAGVLLRLGCDWKEVEATVRRKQGTLRIDISKLRDRLERQVSGGGSAFTAPFPRKLQAFIVYLLELDASNGNILSHDREPRRA